MPTFSTILLFFLPLLQLLQSSHHSSLLFTRISARYKLPGPTVHELLQRLNGNASPTKMIGRKAPGTNGFVLACDAVPWKSSAQREAERLEMMRQQAKEEKGRRNSSQLPPSFATSSQDVDKLHEYLTP